MDKEFIINLRAVKKYNLLFCLKKLILSFYYNLTET